MPKRKILSAATQISSIEINIYGILFLNSTKRRAYEVMNTVGKPLQVQYWQRDLLWQSAGGFVRFVGCELREQRIILLSTDLTMMPEDLIQSYLYRSSIETSFWYSTQIFFNWAYRFWAKIPKLAPQTTQLQEWALKEQNKFIAKLRAYEAYVLIGFFVQALLLYLKSKRDTRVPLACQKIYWFRRSEPTEISLATLRHELRFQLKDFFKSSLPDTAFGKFFTEHLLKLHREQELRQNAA